MPGTLSVSLFLDRVARLSIYTIIIFTPLSNALHNAWAKTAVHWFSLLALSSLLISRSMRRDLKWIHTPLDKPAMALFTWCLISFFFSLHRYTSFWTLVTIANYGTLFYLTLHLFRTRSQTRRLVWTMTATAVLVSLIGLVKIVWGNPFPWWHYEYVRGIAGQLHATFTNRNHLASYIVMMPPLTIGFMLTGVRDAKRAILTASFILFLLVLAMCKARSAWIAGCFGLVLPAFYLIVSDYYPKKKVFWVVSGGFILAVILLLLNTDLTQRVLSIGTDDLSGRLQVWKRIFELIKDHPVAGTGPGTFTYAFTPYHPPAEEYRHALAHNEYLQAIAEAGLPIIAGIVWLISCLFANGFRKIRHPSRLVRGIAIGAMSASAAASVDALASFNFHLPAVAVNASVLAALIVAPDPVSDTSD